MTAVQTAIAGLVVVFVAALGLAVALGRHQPGPGRRACIAGLVGLMLWCAGLAAQLGSSDPTTKRLLGGALYLGICVATLGLSRCLIDLAGRPRIPRWLWALVCLPAVVTPLLVATGWRDLVLANYHAPAAPGPAHSTSGPWFFVHTAWAYGLLVGGLLIFVTVAQRVPGPLRRQAQLLAIVVAAPLLANLIFISGLVPAGGYDPTPYTVLASLTGLGWGLTRARLIDGQIGMVTVARDRVIEAMRDPVLTLDSGGRILDLNPAALDLAGVGEPPLGAPVEDVFPGWPSAPDDGAAVHESSFVVRGRVFDVAMSCLPGAHGLGVGVAVLRDSTRRELSERSTRERADVSDHRASHDDLTGLPNRGAVFTALNRALGRTGADPFALMILDLDGFKALNDSFGHRAGDDVLRELSQRLASIIDPDTLVARLGGDEFAVIVDPCDRDRAEAVAHRIVEGVRVPFTVGGADVRLGGSVGVALAPMHGDTPDTLMYAADVAMYDAKRERLGVSMYAPASGQRQPGRLQLSGELRDAIEQGCITVHYQPQRDRMGDLVGLEALARWEHPRRGLLMPGHFLALAEESNLICELTDAVIGRALDDVRAWNGQAGSPRVSVNLSERDLRDPRLVRRVSDALEARAVAPDALTVEVTENALATARDTARQLHTLRELGVRLSLDDFGTGFAPLSTLRTLAVDEIKIDRTFVSGMDDRDAALVRALVNLGHDLGLVVVAEGVETDRERAELWRLRCDILQGYLLGRPAPLAEIDFSPGADSAGTNGAGHAA